MMDRKGRVWATSKIRDEEPAFCKEGSSNKFAKYYPLTFSNRQASVLRSRDGQVRAHRHVLRHASPAIRQRSGFDDLLQRVARADRRLGQHARIRSNARRAGHTGVVPADRRQQRRRQDHEALEQGRRPHRSEARYRGSLQPVRVIPSPVDNSVWGASEEFPGLHRPYRSRQQSARDLHDGGLQGAGGRHRSARHRHRQQRHRLDRARGQQPSRELRSQQVQGVQRAARAVRHAVRGGLDAARDGRTAFQGHRHPVGLPLLQLGGPAQRVGLGREHAASPPARTPKRSWRSIRRRANG